MASSIRWRPETTDMLTATIGHRNHRHHLVVERLPDGGWDWITWTEAARPIYGQAGDIEQAKREAEQAASELSRPGISPHIRALLQNVSRTSM